MRTCIIVTIGVAVLAASSAGAESNPACDPSEKGVTFGCTQVEASLRAYTVGCAVLVEKKSVVSSWKALDLETEEVLQSKEEAVALFTIPEGQWVIFENEIVCETDVRLSRLIGFFDETRTLQLFHYSIEALEHAGKLTDKTGMNFALFNLR